MRLEILRLLDQRTASPSEIAAELDAPLTHVSYHVRRLASLGLIKLVKRTPKRGVIEHHYAAKPRATVGDRAWSGTPDVVKRGLVSPSAEQAASFLVSAAAHGGFDRSDAHFSRTALELDEKGWKEMAALFHRTLEEVDRIHADSTERLDGDPHHDAIRASAMLMLLEAPEADAAPARTQSRSGSGRARRVKH